MWRAREVTGCRELEERRTGCKELEKDWMWKLEKGLGVESWRRDWVCRARRRDQVWRVRGGTGCGYLEKEPGVNI